MRTGAHALTLLAEPLNLGLLVALGEGSGVAATDADEVAPAAPSTVRRHLGILAGAGATEPAPNPG